MGNEQDNAAQGQATNTESRDYDRELLPGRYVDADVTEHNTENAQHVPYYPDPRAGPSPLDMSSLSNGLPDYVYRAQQHPPYSQHFPSTGSNSNMMYPYQQAQYPSLQSASFGMPYAQQIPMQSYQGQPMYASYPVNMSGSGTLQPYHGQRMYPSQIVGQNAVQPHFQQFPHNIPYAQMPGGAYAARGKGQPHLIHGYGVSLSSQPLQQAVSPDLKRSTSKSPSQSSAALRGPPRKPKQSGHALWVGNLPPGTNIMDLKDYFSRDATDEIESVFLISKSNCAFVNYISELSCAAAMSRFHDSRFMGVRLVCRLRRGSTPGLTPTLTPTGPSAGTISDPRSNVLANLPDGVPKETEQRIERGEEKKSDKLIKERFFIIKSLTIEDLERSAQSGIWATQSHNEIALNKAYKTAENVYLIFSANKSGEYFGYARMDTPIDDEATENLDTPPVEYLSTQKSSTSSTADIPLIISTPATATAPRGRVIDDSARGTIFWEAESAAPTSTEIASTVDGKEETSSANLGPGNVPTDDTSYSPSESSFPLTNSQSNAFGKPFKITWMSSDRLPFYRTRGLRNAWNTNREVKIARDGTELEPIVGRKLVNMFGTPGTGGGNGGRVPQQGYHPMVPGQGPAYRPY